MARHGRRCEGAAGAPQIQQRQQEAVLKRFISWPSGVRSPSFNTPCYKLLFFKVSLDDCPGEQCLCSQGRVSLFCTSCVPLIRSLWLRWMIIPLLFIDGSTIVQCSCPNVSVSDIKRTILTESFGPAKFMFELVLGQDERCMMHASGSYVWSQALICAHAVYYRKHTNLLAVQGY
jgi:hypothetical protein